MLQCPFDATTHEGFPALLDHWARCIRGRGKRVFFCPKTPTCFFIHEEDQQRHLLECACTPLTGWGEVWAAEIGRDGLGALKTACTAVTEKARAATMEAAEADKTSDPVREAAPQEMSSRSLPSLLIEAILDGRKASVEAITLSDADQELDQVTFKPDDSPFPEIWACHLRFSHEYQQRIHELIVSDPHQAFLHHAFVGFSKSTVWLLIHLHNSHFTQHLTGLVKVGNALLAVIHDFPPPLYSSLAALADCATYLEQQLAIVEGRLSELRAQEEALGHLARVAASPPEESALSLRARHRHLLQSVEQLKAEQAVRREAAIQRRQSCFREVKAQLDAIEEKLHVAETQRVCELQAKLRGKEKTREELQAANSRAEKLLADRRSHLTGSKARLAAAESACSQLKTEIGRLLSQIEESRPRGSSPHSQWLYLCTRCRRRFSSCVAAPCMHIQSQCFDCATNVYPLEPCHMCRRRIYALFNVFSAACGDMESDRSEV